MTDRDNSNQEPTMEEILASIRRIISEDSDEQGAEAATNGAASAEPVAAEEPAPQANGREEAEILELTQVVSQDTPSDDADAGHGDMAAMESASDFGDTSGEPEAPEASEFEARGEAPQESHDHAAKAKASTELSDAVEETLLSPEVATAAAAAFGALSKDVTVSNGDGRSLEDMVREMLKPMLKEWLEDNLPVMVESVIEREVQQISRRGGVFRRR